VEILGGQSFDLNTRSRGLVAETNPGNARRVVKNRVLRDNSASDAEMHPRLQAVINAARFHGMALDPL